MIDLKQLKFTKTHEWFNLEGKRGRVGLTQHAQEEISDVVFVELPQAGRAVTQGEEVAVVESVKAAFSVYAPVSGAITQVNESLNKDPGLVNRAPYEAGFLFELEVSDPNEAGPLMDQKQYEAWVKGGH